MVYVLTAHILIALSSIVFTIVLTARPSNRKFYINYGLITATLTSGVVLVQTSHSNVLHSTVSGLVYLAIVAVGTILAEKRATRLAHSVVRIKSRAEKD